MWYSWVDRGSWHNKMLLYTSSGKKKAVNDDDYSFGINLIFCVKFN